MAGENTLEVPQPEKIILAPSSAEKIASPETKAEQISVAPEKAAEVAKVSEPAPVAPRPVTPVALSYQEQRAQAIDAILSEGLNEIFLKMDANRQQEFKKRGEETVTKINTLLDRTKDRKSVV